MEKLALIPLGFLLPLPGLVCVMASIPDEGPEPTTIQPLDVMAAAGGAFSFCRSSSHLNCPQSLVTFTCGDGMRKDSWD